MQRDRVMQIGGRRSRDGDGEARHLKGWRLLLVQLLAAKRQGRRRAAAGDRPLSAPVGDRG